MGKIPNDKPENMENFGACCACGAQEGVRNILMLKQRAPVPGTGWGCYQCGLASDGAVAVTCDHCLETGARIERVCLGYPLDRKRTDITELSPEVFDHNRDRHPELTMGECARCEAPINLWELLLEQKTIGQFMPNGVTRLPSGAAIGPTDSVYCTTCGPHVVFCRVCGCTDEEGCPEGCWWVEEDLCSSCRGAKSV